MLHSCTVCMHIHTRTYVHTYVYMYVHTFPYKLQVRVHKPLSRRYTLSSPTQTHFVVSILLKECFIGEEGAEKDAALLITTAGGSGSLTESFTALTPFLAKAATSGQGSRERLRRPCDRRQRIVFCELRMLVCSYMNT